MKTSFSTALLAVATLVSALNAPQGATAQTQPITLIYEGRALGVTAAKTTMVLAADSNGYSLSMETTSAGLASVAGFTSSSSANGRFDGRAIKPDRYLFTNRTRDKSDLAVVDFNRGNVTYNPPRDIPAHERIPASMIQGSLDPLSSLFGLMLQVGQTGSCNGASRIFEGRNVVDVRSSTLGSEDVRNLTDVPLRTLSVRCLVQSTPIAGKIMRQEQKDRLVPAEVWIAQPTGANFPVPIKIQARVRGVPLTMTLSAIR